MRVSVLVPLAGDGIRGDVWRWLRAHYWQAEYPEWQVEVGTDHSAAFSKGRAVSHAYYRASGGVLVIADADSFVTPDAVRDAVARVEAGTPWVVPFAVVQRLSPQASVRYRAGTIRDDRELAGGVYRTDAAVVPGGGVVVLSRAAYEQVDGIDPRFTVWGAEVDSFGWALRMLVGEYVQLGGTLWHLWHEPAVAPNGRTRREGEPELNKCLGRAYREAFDARDVDRMRRLCSREEGCASAA